MLILGAILNGFKPDPAALPGGNEANTFVNGLAFYGLLFCVAGLVLSAGLWAVGAFSNNYNQSINGKKGFLVCVAAALVIGASQYLVNFFYTEGNTKVNTGGVGTATP